MDAEKLVELKFHFEKNMEKYSTRNKDSISTAWEKLVDMHQARPYHNLNLAYNDLKTASQLGFSIPFFVVVAAVLRYADFDPASCDNTEKSVHYAKFFLEQPFGWTNNNIEQVTNVIRDSFIIVTPSDDEPYASRLIHDMKNARFARLNKSFLQDRQNAKKEFNHITERKFYSSEQSLLKCYQHVSKLFTLNGFNSLIPQAEENIKNRAAYIREIIMWLDSNKNKKS